MGFYNKESLFLTSQTARELYEGVKDSLIIDFHCHLDAREIEEDKNFTNIGEFWLARDHYKWRAMRICGVDERLITGGSSWHEKFHAFAGVMPKLCGSPLYHWAHMELSALFGISSPLDENSAERIWREANPILSELSPKKLLKHFKVEYVGTTDDIADSLPYHGKKDGLTVAPTFRTDRLFGLDEGFFSDLGSPGSLSELKAAITQRLDFFIKKGMSAADCSLDFSPNLPCGEEEAERIFLTRDASGKQAFISHMLCFLCSLYQKNGVVFQLHLGTHRNVNPKMFSALGRDSGFDIERGGVDVDSLARFFGFLENAGALPKTILYTLNSNYLEPLAVLAGGFRNVYLGSAWWFNDTAGGIKKQLSALSEYHALGVMPGMVSDSRSFSSYVRFDFFRRILASFAAERVDGGEYDKNSAKSLMEDICYNNARRMFVKKA